jgi:DNA-binding transcriptional regulator YdaS (Cro superfamily)
MLNIVRRAADIAFDGNVAALAAAIGAPRPSLYYWKKAIPAQYCRPIVKATKGKLKLSELRPDLWGRG